MYDIAVGPYDVLFALCWDRDAPGSPTRLVQLVPDFGAPLCCHPKDGLPLSLHLLVTPLPRLRLAGPGRHRMLASAHGHQCMARLHACMQPL